MSKVFNIKTGSLILIVLIVGAIIRKYFNDDLSTLRILATWGVSQIIFCMIWHRGRNG